MANSGNGSYGVTQTQTLLIMLVVFLVMFVLIAVPFYNSYKQKYTLTRLRRVYASLMQANRMYSLVAGDNQNDFNTTLPVNVFAETYYTPYLTIQSYCKGKQDDCWNSPQYKDLNNHKVFDKSFYSIILEDGVVIGFNKNKQGLLSMIIDIDGKAGANKLGRDIFVFYFYNNKLQPKICSADKYSKYNIQNGLHFGGYDRCGIPQDIYTFNDLTKKELEDGCNKRSEDNPIGLGAGAACTALIRASNWSIAKKYPW